MTETLAPPRMTWPIFGLQWHGCKTPADEEARATNANNLALEAVVVGVQHGVMAGGTRMAVSKEATDAWKASKNERNTVHKNAWSTPAKNKGDETGGYKYRVFRLPELAAFMERLRTTNESCLNLFEDAYDDRPRRIGFDIELEEKHTALAERLFGIDFQAVFGKPELFLTKVFVDGVLPKLSTLVGRNVTPADCYLLDSSSKTRLSFHVVTNLVLQTPHARAAFDEWVQSSLKPMYDEMLDCGVYGSSRMMRLVHNTKPGRHSFLRPATQIGSIPFASLPQGMCITVELLRLTMWNAFIGESAIVVDDRVVAAAPAKMVAPKKTSAKAGASTVQSSASGTKMPEHLENLLKKAGFDFLHEVRCYTNENPNHKFRLAGYDANMCQFKLLTPCPLCHCPAHANGYWCGSKDGSWYVKSRRGVCPRLCIGSLIDADDDDAGPVTKAPRLNETIGRRVTILPPGHPPSEWHLYAPILAARFEVSAVEMIAQYTFTESQPCDEDFECTSRAMGRMVQLNPPHLWYGFSFRATGSSQVYHAALALEPPLMWIREHGTSVWRGLNLSSAAGLRGSRSLSAAAFQPLCVWFEDAYGGESKKILRFSREAGGNTFHIGGIGISGCEPWLELKRLRDWVARLVLSDSV